MIYWTLIWYCIKFFYDKNIQGRFKDVNIWSKTSINFQPIFNVAATSTLRRSLVKIFGQFSMLLRRRFEVNIYCNFKPISDVTVSSKICPHIFRPFLTSLRRRKLVENLSNFSTNVRHHCNVAVTSKIGRKLWSTDVDIRSKSNINFRSIYDFSAT